MDFFRKPKLTLIKGENLTSEQISEEFELMFELHRAFCCHANALMSVEPFKTRYELIASLKAEAALAYTILKEDWEEMKSGQLTERH